MALSGWNQRSLAFRYKNDKDGLVQLCLERHFGDKKKVLDASPARSLVRRLMQWQVGPFASLEGWTEEQILARCTLEDVRDMCEKRALPRPLSKAAGVESLLAFQEGPEEVDLEGWTVEQLLVRCDADELEELLAERYLKLSGSCATMAARLVAYTERGTDSQG